MLGVFQIGTAELPIISQVRFHVLVTAGAAQQCVTIVKEWSIDKPNEKKIIKFVQAGYSLTLGSILKSLETFFNKIDDAVPL